MELLLKGEPGEWLECLPRYQRDPLNQLLSAGKTYEEVALAWLSATASNTAPSGANRTASNGVPYLERVGFEIRAYICGSTRYKKERDGLFGQKGLVRSAVVTGISVAIAPKLGMSPVVIAPPVALILASIGKVAVSAFCDGFVDK